MPSLWYWSKKKFYEFRFPGDLPRRYGHGPRRWRSRSFFAVGTSLSVTAVADRPPRGPIIIRPYTVFKLTWYHTFNTTAYTRVQFTRARFCQLRSEWSKESSRFAVVVVIIVASDYETHAPRQKFFFFFFIVFPFFGFVIDFATTRAFRGVLRPSEYVYNT